MTTLSRIVLFVGIFFCCTSYAQENEFSIVASLSGFEDSTKFYLLNLDSTRQIDSTYLRNGHLVFNGQISEPVVFRLYPEADEEFIYFNFWIESTAISLKGSRGTFSDLRVEGSPLNAIYQLAESKHSNLEKLRNKLVNLALNEADQNKALEIWKSISEVDKKILNIRLQTIATFEPSLITIKELYFLRNDLTTDSLKMFFDRFPTNLKRSKYGEVIAQYLLTDNIKVGMPAVDITGIDFYKNEVKLSSFKKKIVLLDFWASWCGPCRSSNKDLAELYEKYHKSGFEIISFSLDTDLDSWKDASQRDNITWRNISDLKGLYSKQAASYKIRAIPKSFLIDKSGKIIQIFTGYSKEDRASLESKIQKLTADLPPENQTDLK